jgi:sugar O-acyltransferase (sialic acid O-acetyltransferase NeuD family)
MRDLVIVGTGGFAREVHQLVEDVNAEKSDWNVLGFIDDDPQRDEAVVHELPVLGTREWLSEREGLSVAIGVGAPSTRWRILRELAQKNPGLVFPKLVHPLAWVGRRIQMDIGVIVCAGNLLTTDLRLGSHVILNLDCTVGHDCDIRDFVTVAPSVNVSGGVRVGEGCDLGTGSTIIQGTTIGAWTVVGAGAVVVKDLPSNVTAVGIPAKPVKQREEGWYRE